MVGEGKGSMSWNEALLLVSGEGQDGKGYQGQSVSGLNARLWSFSSILSVVSSHSIFLARC